MVCPSLRPVLLFVTVTLASLSAPPSNGADKAALVAPASAEGPQISLSLDEAVSLALRDNRAIKSAYLQRIAQKFDLRVAEDRLSPRLTLSSAYLASRVNGQTSHSADAGPVISMTTRTGAQMAIGIANTVTSTQGGDDSAGAALNFAIIQPLLRDGGSDMATAPTRMARLDEQINRLRLKQTVSRTVTEVILAYRDFLKAQEQVRIADEALARSRSLLAVNQSLIEAGRMAAIDQIQAEADLARQDFAVEEALNQRDSTRLALAATLAISPRSDIVTSDSLQAPPLQGIDLNRALAVAFANAPDYLSQMIGIERGKISLAVAKDQRLWDLAAIGGASLGKSKISGDASTNTAHDRNVYGGLQLTIPLWDLSGEQGEVTATIALRNAQLQLEILHQQVEQQTRDSVRNVSVRKRQLDLADKARDLARRKLEVENEKLKYGRSSNFQVLSFETDLRNAENTRLDAMIAYLNALTILDNQVGTTLDTWQISLHD